MKQLINLASIALILSLVALPTYAQDDGGSGEEPVVHGPNFVDENGDGYNDNAPDHDGDGIPNGQDPDYSAQNPDHNKAAGFIDEDGDGINDRMQDADGDGIPNKLDEDWVRPQNGQGRKLGQKSGEMDGRKGRGNRSGKGMGQGSSPQGAVQSGEGNSGTGECDETGPKGNRSNGKHGGGK